MKLQHSLSPKWTGLEWQPVRAWEQRKARDDEEGEAGSAAPAKVTKEEAAQPSPAHSRAQRERGCHRFSHDSGVPHGDLLLKI